MNNQRSSSMGWIIEMILKCYMLFILININFYNNILPEMTSLQKLVIPISSVRNKSIISKGSEVNTDISIE